MRVKDDPHATEEQLRHLAERDPVGALSNPNCPPALWWKLAQKNPLEAMESASFPLMTLEDPARWQAMEQDHLHAWIDLGVQRNYLPEGHKRLFVADCLLHVLPIFQRAFPDDTRPRSLIQAAISLAQGRIDLSQLHEAYPAATVFAKEIRNNSPFYGKDGFTWAATTNIAEGLEFLVSPPDKLHYALGRCAYAVVTHKEYSPEVLQERLWQWRRLLSYIKAAPDLPIFLE